MNINGNPQFHALLGVDVRPFTEKVEGMSYIPWARAHGMAGRPAHRVLTFDGPQGPEPVRRLFGGTAVAVAVPVGTGKEQVSYLPLLDLKGRPIPAGMETSRDVGDGLGRGIARGIAMTLGLGLSLYSRCEGDGKSYVDALCIDPDTPDIGAVAPLRDVKGKAGKRQTEYLGWHAAVAACRITDPEFTWEVVEFPQADGSSFPATKLGGPGWMVAVKITYRGQEHVQWLPIMGIATVSTRNGDKPMEHQPIQDPDVMQWHSACMRCLAKAVAIATGYGLALYAKGDVEGLVVEDDGAHQSPRGDSQCREAPQQAPTDGLREQVRALLVDTGSEETLFLGWLGVPSLDAAGEEKLRRGIQALEAKRQGQQQSRS